MPGPLADEAIVPAIDRTPLEPPMDGRDAVREKSEPGAPGTDARRGVPEDRVRPGVVQSAHHGFHEEGHQAGQRTPDHDGLPGSGHRDPLLNPPPLLAEGATRGRGGPTPDRP